MRQLLVEGPGRTRWADVPDVELSSPAAAIVRPLAVATCDLDVAVLRGRYPFEYPYPFGHEAVAEVLDVGDDVRTVRPGDLVVVPFQISCGECGPCTRGRTGNCASVPRLSTFGLGTMGGLAWGGLLADCALVPYADAMLVRVPNGIAPAAIASVSDNIADAWRTVGPQLQVATRRRGTRGRWRRGSELDRALRNRSRGRARCGACRVCRQRSGPARRRRRPRRSAREGPFPRKLGAFAVTVDASGDPAGLRCALNSTAFDGTCTSPSVYLDDPPLPLFAMYSRCCTFHTGRAHARPAIDPVLDAVLAGFDPSVVTSAVVDWEDAPTALADPPLKLVMTRSPTTKSHSNRDRSVSV